MPDKISGGFYLKARCIQQSWIAHAPPHVREIWDWLLMNANHKNEKSSGEVLGRGQLFTSYKAIRDGLSWKVGYRTERYSKNDCETSMKLLVKHTMVHTTKTTRGMIVTILNFDKYQNAKNYESYNRTYTSHTINIQNRHTIDNTLKKENAEMESAKALSRDVSSEIEKCPYEKIVALYSQILPTLPKIRNPKELHPNIKKHVKNRWGENPSLEWMAEYFKSVSESDFLMGRKTSWKASFPWLMGPENVAKVVGGQYCNNGDGDGGKPQWYVETMERRRKNAEMGTE